MILCTQRLSRKNLRIQLEGHKNLRRNGRLWGPLLPTITPQENYEHNNDWNGPESNMSVYKNRAILDGRLTGVEMRTVVRRSL